MVTAYDAADGVAPSTPRAWIPTLVGDTLAMVVLGYDDTLQVTTADMAHHVGAVAWTRTANARPLSAIFPGSAITCTPAETVCN